MRLAKSLKVIVTVVSFLLCVGACQKPWYCYPVQYDITAIKGTDTIYNLSGIALGTPYSSSTVYADSVIKYYESNGYTVFVDTVYGGTQYQGNDKSIIKAMEEDGFNCVQPD